MALVIPNASSLFPSAAWWQALANSMNAELAQLRGESIGASILTSGTNVDTVTASSTWTTWANSNPNTPETGTGILRTWWVTDTAGAQLWMSATNTASMYLRFRGSGGWAAWKRIDAQYAIDQAKAYTDTAVLGARGGSGSGTKVVPLALTVGGSAAASSLGAVGVRMPMQWGARVTRWRVHVRNINPRFGTNQPGAVSLTGLWFGQGDGSGSFTGAATQINGAVSTPADGSEWVSKWVTTPLEAGTRYLLAYGLNTTGTQSVVGGGWTTASPADAANSAAAKTARTALPLDVWIEAETASTTPVIAAWGDSLSSGVGATLPVYDSVVSQYARANGALPVHYTASGDSAASWAGNLSAYKWTRWATLAKPDVTIAAMGSNDVFNGDALATIQANWQAAVDNIRATISPAVVVTTITPRDGVTGTMETTRRSLNTWLKGLPRGRDVFDLVPAVSSDDETLTPALTSDGIHLTTAGYAAEVGTITRALAFAPSAGPQGPKGDKGDKGDPGGSDAATASWISSGTETQAAFDARAALIGDPRWVVKANQPTVNVKDYGAIPGSGDNTAAINAAAAAAGASRTLFFPEGTYRFADTITGVRGITGSGRARTVLHYTGTGTAIQIAPTLGTRSYHGRFDNFLLRADTTAAVGIDADSHSVGLYMQVAVQSFGTGFWLRSTVDDGGCLYNTFLHCEATTCTTGWLIDTQSSNENRLIASRTNGAGVAVWIKHGNHNHVMNCAFESGTDGVRIEGGTSSDANVIAFNRFEKNSGHAMTVATGVRDTRLILNKVMSTGGDVVDNGLRTVIIPGLDGDAALGIVRNRDMTGSTSPLLAVRDKLATVGDPVTVEIQNERFGGKFLRGMRGGTERFFINAEGVIKPFSGSTLPSPSRAGAGGMAYNTATNKPVWSDGTAWRYADGTPA